MKNRFIVTFLAVFLGFNTLSAQKQFGSWTILNARLNGKGKWGAFFEAQARSINFYNNFFYWETKGALVYSLSKDFSLAAGTGTYNTFTDGGNFSHPLKQEEIRTWLQLQMRQRQGRFSFEHRYRLEQRFIKAGYRNRYRYRFSIVAPINKPKSGPGVLNVTIWNEVFFTNIAPYFERNRVFGGLGYEFNKKFSILTGFIRQYDYKINSQLGRNFLQTTLLFNLDMAKPDKTMPVPED